MRHQTDFCTNNKPQRKQSNRKETCDCNLADLELVKVGLFVLFEAMQRDAHLLLNQIVVAYVAQATFALYLDLLGAQVRAIARHFTLAIAKTKVAQ